MRKLSTFHPCLQLSMIITLALLVSNIPGSAPYLTALYVTLMAAWTLQLLWALRGLDERVQICSQETSMSITAAAWNVILAFAIGVPISGVLTSVALGLVLYRGWTCRAARHQYQEDHHLA